MAWLSMCLDHVYHSACLSNTFFILANHSSIIHYDITIFILGLAISSFNRGQNSCIMLGPFLLWSYNIISLYLNSSNYFYFFVFCQILFQDYLLILHWNILLSLSKLSIKVYIISVQIWMDRYDYYIPCSCACSCACRHGDNIITNLHPYFVVNEFYVVSIIISPAPLKETLGSKKPGLELRTYNTRQNARELVTGICFVCFTHN